MDDLTKSILDEVENTPYKENYGYGKTAEVSGGDEANYASSFGIVVAICGALFVFGGQTFAIWTFGIDAEMDDEKTSLTYAFSADEIYFEFENNEGSEDEGAKYDDEECDCNDLKDFFANLKLMFYALIGCGIAIALRGMGNLPAVAGITAVLSITILAYTFVSLPEAFEDDIGMFEMIEEDATFYMNDEKDVDGANLHTKAMPHIGFFLPVITLTLCSYLIFYNRD